MPSSTPPPPQPPPPQPPAPPPLPAMNMLSSEAAAAAPGADAKIRVEFAININKQNDLAKIDEALKSSKGARLVWSDVERQSIQLELSVDETNSPLGSVTDLQRFIERQTGFVAVVKGLGQLSSAVAEMRSANSIASQGQQVMGVVRLSQLADGHCFVDAAVEGLGVVRGSGGESRHYALAIHEFGDLAADDLSSIGNPLISIDKQPDVGQAKLSIRRTVPKCDVASMIGRSVALAQHSVTNQPTSEGQRILSAGVIARASTIEANKKQICSCSGKTLWEERLERKQHEQS